ncbi:MAG: DUF4382 domain-containing protein [Myxococcota bacterium]
MTNLRFLTLGLLFACKDDVKPADEIPDGVPTGPIVVTLGESTASTVALPTSVEEVWIRLEDVQVHHETKGWVGIIESRKDIDLLALQGADAQSIGRDDVYEGGYDSLRLVLADAWLVVDGVEADLLITDVLSIPVTELTYDATYFVDDSTTTTLAVQWGIGDQLVETGSGWELGTDGNFQVDIHD